MNMEPLSRNQLAHVVAADLPRYAAVNLGIGMPTLVAKHLPPDSGVLLHSENGILGMRGLAAGESSDPDLINASKEFVRLTPSASIFDHALSFAIMRGGHLDVTVLGAFEVAANGDLANWSLGENDPLPSVGGAMDLAQGARAVWVMMNTCDRNGRSRLRERCALPLTGQAVVDRIYTEIGVFEIAHGKFHPLSLVRGADPQQVRSRVAGPLAWNEAAAVLTPPLLDAKES